jgi:hypothetical protein
MKKFNIYIYTLVFSLFALSSCDFGDTNIDPSNPADVPISSLLPAAQTQIAYIIGGDMGRYNGVFTQHYGGVSRQHLVIGRYGLSESDVNTTWNQLYSGALQDMTTMIAKSGDVNSPHYSAVAKVTIATLLGAATDVWGNVPYTEAAQGIANLKPAYDTRDEIYATIHRLLGEARAEFGQTSELALGDEDLYFGGDIDKWIAVSHTLDARYYLHRGDYTQAITSATSGIASNADDYAFSFGTAATEQNPLYQFQDQRSGDLTMGEFFVDLLESINDPRLPFFATELSAENGGGYAGAPAGKSATASLPGAYYASQASPVVLTSYVENQFIIAEANFKKAASDKAAAATALNKAIVASVMKITGAANTTFTNAEAVTAGTISETSIMTHKYIAWYTQTETWNDIRRTGIPVLTAASNSSLDAGDMPTRWPYPQGERDFNNTVWKSNTPSENIKTVLTTDLSW